MLKIVLVGTGWWGMELARAAKALPGQIDLAGCCSLSAEERARFQGLYGGKAYPAYEEVLAEPGVDAVLLATPHSLHWKQIIQAADAKKHVFCEKPLALSVETASMALKACERNGVILAVGHNRRYMPGARKMKAIVDAGELGRIIHVEANYSANIERRYPKDHWRAQQDEMPCAGLAPMGLHMVDTLAWLLGPVVRLVGISKHQVLSYPLQDTCAALFELQSGVTGTLGSHLACAQTAILRIYGTRANLEARDNFSEVSVEPADPGAPRVLHRYGVDDSLAQELGALADACSGKAPFPVKPIEALRNIAVLEAIRQSAAANSTWVQVAQGPAD